MDIETCPHGSRITCEVGSVATFIDPCSTCQDLLADLGIDSRIVQRETVTAA